MTNLAKAVAPEPKTPLQDFIERRAFVLAEPVAVPAGTTVRKVMGFLVGHDPEYFHLQIPSRQVNGGKIVLYPKAGSMVAELDEETKKAYT